jgi:hypothetical protein
MSKVSEELESILYAEMPEQAYRGPGGVTSPFPIGQDMWGLLIERYASTPLVEDFRARRALGESRYGTRLYAFNGRDAQRDLREELLDALVYAEQAGVEGKLPRERVSYIQDLIIGILLER